MSDSAALCPDCGNEPTECICVRVARKAAAAGRPERVGDRVVCPDGTKGVIAFVHPTIPGAVVVQPDTPDLRAHMREELKLDDE